MSLTGSLLAWTIWIVAIALFVWVIIDWARFAGPGWLSVLRRIGYQSAVVISLLLAVGITLNSQYGWYANWGDLGSIFSTANPGTVVASGASATDATGPGGSSAGFGSTPGHDVVPLATVPALGKLGLSSGRGPADGTIKSFRIPGKVSGVKSYVDVWFPASYTDPKMATHRYPVIEAFHGVPGTPRQLWYNMHLGTSVAEQVAAGKIADSIVVMPDWAPGQIDTECVDGGAGQLQMEQWLTQDVTTWVDHHLRVVNDRSSWATFGLSAGAWCASMLTMLHPSIYSAAISLGGYFQPGFEAPYVPFKPGSPAFSHYDLLKLAKDNPPKVALWVQTSKGDPLSYGTAQQLLSTTRPPMSVTADVLPNAGHRVSVWIPLIPQTLQWLGATVPGFRPGTVPLAAGRK
ncbi:esterase family protein [Nakamurella sp. PAMC28650]|uniref:alpha/beta hydrolase n=1 Tax=Nakamurella sp. PAMC28650 TaxID=2762325 RepID=UPI00164DB84B|nr:alpha/beta hydrolase-fold protein [Nakamurella sp. PAMC28650]QNK82313.1 hypothetical protein H7F38_06125 [Nakamurella sp. PAMC28650]